MQQPDKISSPEKSRRKALWGIGVLAFLPLLKLRSFSFFNKKNTVECAPSKQAETVKFLTQDGTLVEVDASRIAPSAKKKISNKELLAWVKRK